MRKSTSPASDAIAHFGHVIVNGKLAEWQVPDYQSFELPADLEELVGVSDSEDFEAEDDYDGHDIEEA